MRRAATSVCLAGWIGFLSVSGSIGALAILRAADIGIPPLPWIETIAQEDAATLLVCGNAVILATTLATLLEFMIVAFLGLAFVLVHSRDAPDRTSGETFAVIGIGCVGVMALATGLGGFDLFERYGTPAGFAIVVVFSIAAVLFDRMIAIEAEDDPAEEANFRAAVALIGGQMARDAASRTKPEPIRPERES